MSWDAYESNPTFLNAVALGIDVALTAMPYVPAVGGISIRGLSKFFSKADDLGRAATLADKAGDLGKGGRQLERASKANTFSRYMSKAEVEAIEKTGYLRGAREGDTFLTTNKYQTVKSAKSKLALETPPEVRLDFKIKNKPDIGKLMRVDPTKVEPGGGIQFVTKDKVQVDIIRRRDLR